jgi:hypothetical protein
VSDSILKSVPLRLSILVIFTAEGRAEVLRQDIAIFSVVLAAMAKVIGRLDVMGSDEIGAPGTCTHREDQVIELLH